MLEHGGDPTERERVFGRPDDGWLDLSTGINPLPYPVRDLAPESWGPLPAATELTRLRHAAATRYGVPDAALVVPAPGTQALIQWLPRMRAPSRVCVLSPTYNEHAHCWRTAGHTVVEIDELAGAGANTDVIIVVNPNNPDGHSHDPDKLKSLAAAQARHGGWLIVDEAFCDMTPELSLAAAVGTPGLIVLRSFGKFYGLAGLRLGFALTDSVMAERLSTFLGPWAVSTPAISIGADALNDEAWTNNTRRLLRESAERMDRLLSDYGLGVIGGTTLFRLVSTIDADSLYSTLASCGILIRCFQYNSHWLRFGLPDTEDDWQRLEAALRASPNRIPNRIHQ